MTNKINRKNNLLKMCKLLFKNGCNNFRNGRSQSFSKCLLECSQVLFLILKTFLWHKLDRAFAIKISNSKTKIRIKYKDKHQMFKDYEVIYFIGLKCLQKIIVVLILEKIHVSEYSLRASSLVPKVILFCIKVLAL